MNRDLTKPQFLCALKRRGMKQVPYMGGYIDVGNGVHVYRYNAGPRLREQLRYLIQEQRKRESGS